MPTVLLGVSGGIAVYKAAELTSLLRKRGWEVRVVMTPAATQFVTPLTFQTLSRQRVHLEPFEPSPDGLVEHIDLVKEVDLAVVAPATANLLAKTAHGIADDLLTTTLLALRCPLIVAPAMNTAMWEHPATQENLRILAERGVDIVQPASGELACGDVGLGKLADVEAIAQRVAEVHARRANGNRLKGRRVLITAGGTREPLDPVRYLGNRSSGKMGHALAEAAVQRGAEVTLVTTSALPVPSSAEVVRVQTAAEMLEAVQSRLGGADLLVMAAAVADYRPATTALQKIKKTAADFSLVLEPTPDILATLKPMRRADQLIVGFAAETEQVLSHAQEKLARKGLDLIVANDVSQPGIGFESDQNAVTVLGPEGQVALWEVSSKRAIAERLMDLFGSRIPSSQTSCGEA
jgi:phosphopantothenoylcysteine decarboxylase/phosphopantothenate--cysteine ligase